MIFFENTGVDMIWFQGCSTEPKTSYCDRKQGSAQEMMTMSKEHGIQLETIPLVIYGKIRSIRKNKDNSGL